MISREKLAPILANYKSRFLSIWKNEKYKWKMSNTFKTAGISMLRTLESSGTVLFDSSI